MQDGEAGGGTGRPRVTIEGSAREVENGAGGAAEAAPRSPSAGPEAAGAGTGAADETAAPPSAAMVWRPRLITAAISAGVAVVVVFLAVFALRYGSEMTARGVRAVSGAEAPREELAALRDEVAAVQARLASDQDLEDRLSDLEQRAESLEAAVAAAAEARAAASGTAEQAARTGSDNASRLADLETRFDALDAAAVDTSDALAALRDEIASAAEAGTSAAAVAARVARASRRLDALAGRVSGLEQNVSALTGDINEARAAASSASTAQQALAGRVDDLEAAARAGDTGDGAAAGRRIDDIALPAATAVHALLAGKAAAGEPFTREIAALRRALGDIPELDALSAHAAAPPPTLHELEGRLGAMPAGTGQPPAATSTGPSADGGDGILSRLLEQAESAVQVRRVDGATDSGASDSAAQMIANGDLAGAVEAVAAAPDGPAREVWLADARARLALDNAVAALGAVLDRRLAAARPE